ncbi:MAG TPA: radical SAM protein [Acidobacteriota bacterium]
MATARTASPPPPAAATSRGRPANEEIEPISLAINEIFVSIQGESTWAGRPCVFLRTTGCPLRCRWCDTEYAFFEGRRWRLEALVEEACRHDIPLVEITGGEPLAQPGTPALAAALQRRGKTVLVETSGSFDISVLPEGCHAIMDLKCPSSGEGARNDLANLDRLRPGDEIKFVIGTRDDYEWAADMVRERRLTAGWAVLFSPVWKELDPNRLAQWILHDRLEVHLQLQLHKILWPDVERGV